MTFKFCTFCFVGLKTGLVEKFDFSSGTSSRSTKLIHGGVRYLQKAVFNLDIEQVWFISTKLKKAFNFTDKGIQMVLHNFILFNLMMLWALPAWLFLVLLFQYRMVKEALAERANLIQIAPHLAYPFPIMLPIYKLVLSSLVHMQITGRFLYFYRNF